MITNPKDRITPAQAALFVANSIMATGILMLHRGAVDAVGTADVWISVIIGGMIALAAGYVMDIACHLYRRHVSFRIEHGL